VGTVGHDAAHSGGRLRAQPRDFGLGRPFIREAEESELPAQVRFCARRSAGAAGRAQAEVARRRQPRDALRASSTAAPVGYCIDANHAAAQRRHAIATSRRPVGADLPHQRARGNTLFLTPLIRRIHELLPHAAIDLALAYPQAEELLRNFPACAASSCSRTAARGSSGATCWLFAVCAPANTTSPSIRPRIHEWTHCVSICRAQHRLGYASNPVGTADACRDPLPACSITRSSPCSC